jgi:hypothetical protein
MSKQKIEPALQAFTELANMKDNPEAIQQILDRHPEFAVPVPSATANLIHWLWENRNQAYDMNLIRTMVDGTPPIAEGLTQEKVVMELRDLVRQIWQGQGGMILTVLLHRGEERGRAGLTLNIGIADWKRGEISNRAQTSLQGMFHLLLRNSPRVKLCANPDCQHPYFIASRPIQRYCSPACLRPFQNKWKRDWWEQKGKGWRAANRRKTKKKGGK